MGLEMPPVRRRGYSGSGANYSVRNGPQSAGSLPNLHQHISVRSSSSNTSSPSTSHHHRTAAELSLLGDDSSDSGVSSRSPTPNNNFLASAGAAGDQGPPDERFIIKKTLKEIKQINSTSSNNTSKSSNNNSTTRVTSSHQRQPYYPYQHNHHSFQHNHQLQQQQRNHQHHNNTHRYHHSNNNNNNSNNSKSNSNNSGNNSNSSSNTSVNNSNSNSSNPKRRFSHSNHHCPQIPTSGRGRRSGLVVHVPSPPPPSSPTPSQPSMSSLIQPPQTSLLNNHLNSPLLYSGTPPDRFLSKSHLVQVTKTPPQLANGSRWDELSKAVWNKFLTNQQTEETYRKKLALWKCLYVYIKMMFPRYGLFLVGSTLSGFGSNTSDVDMCLLVRRQEMDQRSEALLHLSNVLHHLHHLDIIEKLELVQAKVPILKFRERNQGIDVDLNCNNAVGIRNTHLLSCYAKLDWRVRPLVLVVKLWAQWHDINDAKNMTISSYSLALMVIHFLQCGVSPPVLPCLHLLYQSKFSPYSDISTIDIHEEIQFQSENTQPLGELLLQFFSYYDAFDYSLYAVSVRLACRIPIEECRRVRTLKNEPHQWKYLCIEEPFDQTNTARSVYDLEAFERIRSIIHVTHCSLNTTHSLDSIFRLETSRSCHHSHHHHLHGHQHHHNSQHQQQSLGTGWSNQHQPYSVQMTQIPQSVPCQSHSHTSQSSTSSQTQSHLL